MSKERRATRLRHPIFVLDLLDKPSFAFAAECQSQAEQFSGTEWFTRAAADFCASRGRTWDGLSRRTRAATPAEAAIYHEFAEEFAEPANGFFIVHLA